MKQRTLFSGGNSRLVGLGKLFNIPFRVISNLHLVKTALVFGLALPFIMPSHVMAESGDFNIDFVAAAPLSYNHLTGGGAYDDRTIGVANDVVESLEGGDFACGDIVTYLTAVTVDNTSSAAADQPQTIELDYSFLADTTGQSGVALGDISYVGVNYGPIEDLITGENTIDDGISDNAGSTATLISKSLTGPLFTKGSELLATIELTDLDVGEQVVVRTDVKLVCDPGSRPTGNLQGDLQAARLKMVQGSVVIDPPEAIPGGAQTIPFKQTGNIAVPELAITKEIVVDFLDDEDPSNDITVDHLTITSGDTDTVTYWYKVENPSEAALYNLAVVDDAATPAITVDDFTVLLFGLTDIDGDGEKDDLAAGTVVYGTADVLVGDEVGSYVNTATATGDDSYILPTQLTAVDTATLTINAPEVVPPQPRIIKGGAEGLDTIATLDEPGGLVTIAVIVFNDAESGPGDAILTTLSDDLYGDITSSGHDSIISTTCETGVLLSGLSNYSCSFTVEIESQPATIIDTVTATLTNDAATVSDTDQAQVVVEDVPPSVAVTKTTSTPSIDEPGGTATYQVTVENTSTVEPVMITSLNDNLFGDLTAVHDDITATNCALGSVLAVSDGTTGSGPDFYSCSFSATVSGNAGETHTNIVTGVVKDDEEGTASDTGTATVTFRDVPPTVAVTKTTSTPTIDEPGGTATYQVTVENTSLVESVTIISLNDNLFGDLTAVHDDITATNCALGSVLAVSDGTTGSGPDFYSCSFSATVSGNAGETHTNIVTGVVKDDEEGTASDTGTATVTFRDVPPTVAVTKTTSTPTIDEPGGTATYQVTVENTSLVESVTIISLNDNLFGDLTAVHDDITATNCALGSVLAVSDGTTGAGADFYSCSFSATVSGNAGETHTNIVTGVVKDDEEGTASDTGTATVTFRDVPPSVAVTKTTSTPTIDEPGGTVTYQVTVENTSTVEPVMITSLTDNLFGDLTSVHDNIIETDCAIGAVLAVNDGVTGSGADVYTCAFSANVVGNAGQTHTNVVTGIVRDDDGGNASDTGTATVTFADILPDIEITKSADPTQISENGGDVVFTIRVDSLNSEPVLLESLSDSIFGDLNGQGSCLTPQNLSNANPYECSFTRFVEGSVAGSSHINIATAVAKDDDGNSDEASDDAEVTFIDELPVISVTKTPAVEVVPEGGDYVTYVLEITNESGPNDPVTITSILDDKFGDIFGLSTTCILSTIIQPGASYSCSFTGYVNVPGGGLHQNIVTVSGIDDEENSASANDSANVIVFGNLCDPSKPLSLTVLYDGDDDSSHEQMGDEVIIDPIAVSEYPLEAYVIVTDDKKAQSTLFEGNVTIGELFTVQHPSRRMPSRIFFSIYDSEGGNLVQTVAFHASCSQPLSAGDEFGAITLVTAAH